VLFNRSKKETQDEEGLGRSKGGFTSKIHMISDAHGMPLAFCVTGGQRADCTQAVGLLEQFQYEYAMMDKAYDSQAIVEHIHSTGAVAVIPSKKNRKIPRSYDEELYKERHVIECTFGWLKYFRRIFSRFEKLKSRFCDYFALAASLYRLRYLNNA
jgi:transposase